MKKQSLLNRYLPSRDLLLSLRPGALASGRHLPPSASLRLCVSSFFIFQPKRADPSSIWRPDAMRTHLPLPVGLMCDSFCNKKLEFARIIPPPLFFWGDQQSPSRRRRIRSRRLREQRKKPASHAAETHPHAANQQTYRHGSGAVFSSCAPADPRENIS